MRHLYLLIIGILVLTGCTETHFQNINKTVTKDVFIDPMNPIGLEPTPTPRGGGLEPTPTPSATPSPTATPVIVNPTPTPINPTPTPINPPVDPTPTPTPTSTPNPQVQENFLLQKTNGKVDILFVMDNSLSMYEDQQWMAWKFDHLFDNLLGVDWQIGITTTDVSTGLYGMQGSLAYFGYSGLTYINSSTSDYHNLFLQTIHRDETINWSSEAPSDSEQALKASMLAMNKRDYQNYGFFRNDAELAVVVITDEDEGGYRPWWATKPADVKSHFESIWGTSKKLSFHGIMIPNGDFNCLNYQNDQHLGEGAKYSTALNEMVALTGGNAGSICDSDFSSTLANIGHGPVPNYIELSQVPDPSSVQITFVPLSNSVSYQIQSNKITFTQTPISGTQVKVSYRPL